MATATKDSTAPPKKTYKELIITAITTLKERNGSSRQAIKKYIQSNFPITNSNFDSQFNLALKKGVVSGHFIQPKGPSGPVKLNKETLKSEKKPVKKAAPKKAAAPKKSAPKKTAAKKETTKKTTKKAAPKKAATKKTTAKVTKPAAKKASTKKVAPKKK
ncbi:hypothetical protein B5S28_g2027 [[Candida] boidinii]|nr:hypothetical protein B5S28_g2027 [[Candida] boidinii]OWB60052.1 hypothetical protein B5S29_g919 [[Candida] boidinii]OWB71902.1 hypothetical protein B5S31_g1599 [[Candida] boidinii]OWB77048.1 hypothetical protein B5S32_g1207 [[Candida] boidinii]